MSQSTATLQQWRFPSGVPQGSIPRCQTFYHTNDLPSCVDSSNSSNMEMFVECSIVFVIVDSVDQNVLQQQHSWARLNCKSIHPIKTEPIPPIILESHLINCTTQSSGSPWDNKLCWTPHIKCITANFNANINKRKQIKSFDLLTLEPIYFQSMLSSTTYCIFLWGFSYSLQVLEESHIRQLLDLFVISAPLSQSMKFFLKWIGTPYHIYKKRLACIAYQANYNFAPQSITNLFPKHATNYN